MFANCTWKWCICWLAAASAPLLDAFAGTICSLFCSISAQLVILGPKGSNTNKFWSGSSQAGQGREDGVTTRTGPKQNQPKPKGNFKKCQATFENFYELFEQCSEKILGGSGARNIHTRPAPIVKKAWRLETVRNKTNQNQKETLNFWKKLKGSKRKLLKTFGNWKFFDTTQSRLKHFEKKLLTLGYELDTSGYDIFTSISKKNALVTTLKVVVTTFEKLLRFWKAWLRLFDFFQAFPKSSKSLIFARFWLSEILVTTC